MVDDNQTRNNRHHEMFSVKIFLQWHETYDAIFICFIQKLQYNFNLHVLKCVLFTLCDCFITMQILHSDVYKLSG